MNSGFLFFILLVLAILVQRILIPVNWVMMLVLSVALIDKEERVAWLAFGAGLILDLFGGFPLGSSSLIFLSLSLVVILAKRRFPISYPPTVFFLGFLTDLIYNFCFFKQLTFKKSFVFAILFLSIYFLILRKKVGMKKGLELKID